MALPIFTDFIKTMDICQLRECQSLINDAIICKSKGEVTPSPDITGYSTPVNVNEFVEYIPDFIMDKCDSDILSSELESFGFTKSVNHKNPKVQNKFMFNGDQSYTWDSKGGPVINNPVSFVKYPKIASIMSDINKRYDYKLNSALVSYYASGQVAARLHDDNEECMDREQPICVVTVGTERKIEFVDKQQPNYRAAVLTLEPQNGSLYVMKAGCQDKFLHRVRKDFRIRQDRYCISFRCFVHPSNKPATPKLHATPMTTPALSTPIIGTALAACQNIVICNVRRSSMTSSM